MKTLYIECNMGAAGDMLMAALYEICSEKELFLQKMNEAFAPFDITLAVEPAVKCGVGGTHMAVSVHGEEEAVDTAADSVHREEDAVDTPHSHEHQTDDDLHTHSPRQEHRSHEHVHEHQPDGHSHGHVHRDYHTILKEIQSLPLPEKVKTDAAAVYTLLGNAEAKVHRTTLEHIHFHEVGSLDALADVVGCCYLFYLIAPEEVLCSPVHVGSGFVKCAHGVLPVPAPATAELLKDIPSYTGAVAGELCTPTGAALLRYFAAKFTSMPPLSVKSIGYGMGKKDFEIANCVRVFLGESFSGDNHAASAGENSDDENYEFPCDDTVLSISCNLDDMTGEAIGLAVEILLAAGALDVYTTPVQMKKNRPGVLLTCICPPEERDRFTVLFFLHTTTRGVRYQLYERAKLESVLETRHSSYGDIRVKKSSGYGIEKEKPEFEDLKAIVMKHKCTISLEDVKKHCP